MKRIALLGDYSDSVVAHRAIPLALRMAVESLGVDIRWDWLHSATLTNPVSEHLHHYSAISCVPGSPYKKLTVLSKQYALHALISFRFWEPVVAFNTQ